MNGGDRGGRMRGGGREEVTRRRKHSFLAWHSFALGGKGSKQRGCGKRSLSLVAYDRPRDQNCVISLFRRGVLNNKRNYAVFVRREVCRFSLPPSPSPPPFFVYMNLLLRSTYARDKEKHVVLPSWRWKLSKERKKGRKVTLYETSCVRLVKTTQ